MCAHVFACCVLENDVDGERWIVLTYETWLDAYLIIPSEISRSHFNSLCIITRRVFYFYIRASSS